MSDKIFIGSGISDLDTGQKKNITKVVLTRSNDTWFEAGNDSGDTLEVTNPWATQDMADAILDEVKGAAYLPYTATDALLDPAAEIGDGVTLGGVYSEIVSMDFDLGVASCVGVSAPGVDEIEDEYPYKSSGDREAQRENKRIYSQITKTDKEIRLYVEDEILGVKSSFSQTAISLNLKITAVDGRVSEVSQTVDSFEAKISDIDGRVSSLSVSLDGFKTEISGLNGEISKIDQKVDSITLSAETNGTSSRISLSSQGVEISSADIVFEGLVTFEELGGTPGSGSTLINGSWLQTGTVSASFLNGEQIMLRPVNDWASGVLMITGATTSSSAIELRSYGALRLTGMDGDVFMSNGTDQYVHLNSQQQATDIQTVTVGNANLITNNPNVYLLGLPGQRWKSAYLAEPASIGSDANMKNSVSYDVYKYDAFFDLLKPAKYLYNHGSSGRYHTGFVAQDIEDAVKSAGLESTDFAGYLKDQNTGEYSLRYEEFISLCVDQIQKLKLRVKKMEGTE